MLEFRLLGPFEVVGADGPIAVGGPKQRALLAILVLARGQPVSTGRIIDALWGEQGSPTASNALRVYVSNLRKALGDGVLLTTPGGYRIPSTSGTLDCDRFAALATEARNALDEGRTREARQLLTNAAGLWRGDPLADLAYESFANAEIARLEQLRQRAVEDRIDAELALGNHREVVAELEALVPQYPQRERPLAQLMLALYRCGRQADALEAYRRGRRALRDELGLEPGRDLRALEQRILAQDAALDAPDRPSPSAVASVPLRMRRARWFIASGGAVLLAAAVTAVVVRSGGSQPIVRVEPNSLAMIDARTDRLSAAIPVGARPGPLAYASGAVWVGNGDDQTVSEVNPTSLQTIRTIAFPASPSGIAAGSVGVWVSTPSPSADVVQVNHINPAFDTIDRTVSVGNVVPGTPAPVTDGSGALWIAPFAGEVTELDPRTGQTLSHTDPNAAPSGIAVDAGAAWVTDSTAGTVTRVDPTGLTTPIPVGDEPSAITSGYGYLWVAVSGEDAVARIDPATRAIDQTIRVGAAPKGVAVGEGSVWIADSGDGTVDRVDPTTGQLRARIEVGGSPQDLTVAAGHVWVTVDAQILPSSNPAGGTLRMVAQGTISSLDPALAFDALAFQLLDATCVHLLNFADKAGLQGTQLVPEVAQSLPQRSKDGRSYTFTLRSGFHFSAPSNAPVTATTFQYSIERTLNPRMHSPTANELEDIVGAKAYMAGKAAHIAGIVVGGNTLTISLVAPAPDILTRLNDIPFCAVPTDTPITPQGVAVTASAGPYRVDSYSPGQGVVLTRNPAYSGQRPRVLDRVELRLGMSNERAAAAVEAGSVDYVAGVPASSAAYLAAAYGPGSNAARVGRQQYFVNALAQLDFFELNMQRPLFAGLRMRQAVNDAIDRRALARLGDEYVPIPEHVTSVYLPPGVPGYTNTQVYPETPDLPAARRLAAHPPTRQVVLYTCNVSPCDAQAQIVKTDLAAIGLDVQVHQFSDAILYAKTAAVGEPFDMAWIGWVSPGPDPGQMLNSLLVQPSVTLPFDNPTYRQRLAAANQLSGPARYLAYGNLDLDLARNAAPFAAFGNLSNVDFFSARIGCQTFGPYGMDLAALCLRN